MKTGRGLYRICGTNNKLSFKSRLRYAVSAGDMGWDDDGMAKRLERLAELGSREISQEQKEQVLAAELELCLMALEMNKLTTSQVGRLL